MKQIPPKRVHTCLFMIIFFIQLLANSTDISFDEVEAITGALNSSALMSNPLLSIIIGELDRVVQVRHTLWLPETLDAKIINRIVAHTCIVECRKFRLFFKFTYKYFHCKQYHNVSYVFHYVPEKKANRTIMLITFPVILTKYLVCYSDWVCIWLCFHCILYWWM